MPAYVQNDPEIRSISPGDTQQVLDSADDLENLLEAYPSRPVAIAAPGGVGLAGIRFDGRFSGDPGASQVDCQVASEDVDEAYVTLPGGSFTAFSAAYAFHLDAPNVNARFARILVVSITNDTETLNASIGR